MKTILEQVQKLTGDIQEKRCEEVGSVIYLDISIYLSFIIQELAFIKQELAPYIAANSGYREQKKEFCSPGTRKEPLAEIKEWLLSTKAPHFLWLTGEPGAGKSTITATVCKNHKSTLWAQFFINRNEENTTDPKFFFPSIALQLAKQLSEVAHAIYLALRENSSLIDENNDTLSEQLFIKPLKCVVNSPTILVVVDALDEVKNSDILAEILSKISTHLPTNIKVLITSREEDDIRAALATAPNTKHLSVGTDQKSSIEDVEIFLQDQIQKIATKHKLGEWPGKEDMQKLYRQASGLFVWATTAVAYIGSRIKVSGSEYLDEVLGQLNVEGMGNINKLYHVILDNMYRDQTNPWLFETFRRVVGAIVVLNTPFSVGVLAKILDLRRVDSKNPSKIHRPVDMLNFVRQLRTVLVAGTDEITQETIPRLHKSFFEYVTSKDIKPDLKVSLPMSHKEVAFKCLNYYREYGKVGDPYFQATRSSYQWLANNLPDGDPDFTACLLNFGDLEYSNYQYCYEAASLDTSISVFTRLIEQQHQEPQYLSRLFMVYRSRYQRLHHLADLEVALQTIQKAVALTPAGHPDKLGNLQSLGLCLMYKYRRLGDSQDCEQAIQNLQEVVDPTPGHLDRSGHLESLAVSFTD
jgi:hypothetical protein